MDVYGNFRTRTFADVFQNKDDFHAFYTYNGAFPATLSRSTVDTIWGLLYANYGNSHIKSSDENRFKFKLMSLVYQHGPNWSKRMEIQEKLRLLTDEELRDGAMSIYGNGIHPATPLNDDEIEEAGVNQYSRQRVKKSPVEAYAALYSILEDNVTVEFVNKFRNLFTQIIIPRDPLWYESLEEEN